MNWFHKPLCRKELNPPSMSDNQDSHWPSPRPSCSNGFRRKKIKKCCRRSMSARSKSGTTALNHLHWPRYHDDLVSNATRRIPETEKGGRKLWHESLDGDKRRSGWSVFAERRFAFDSVPAAMIAERSSYGASRRSSAGETCWGCVAAKEAGASRHPARQGNVRWFGAEAGRLAWALSLAMGMSSAGSLASRRPSGPGPSFRRIARLMTL